MDSSYYSLVNALLFPCRWLFDTIGCQAYALESYTGGYAEVGFVVALCIERYIAVRHTEYCELKKKSK